MGITEPTDVQMDDEQVDDLVRWCDEYLQIGEPPACVRVREGRCQIERSRHLDGLTIEHADLVAWLGEASSGLDDVTVAFAGDCSMGFEYGYGGAVEVPELDSITIVVRGWRDLTGTERVQVATQIQAKHDAAAREAEREQQARYERSRPERVGRIFR